LSDFAETGGGIATRLNRAGLSLTHPLAASVWYVKTHFTDQRGSIHVWLI
jgi:hypothetical protein